MERRIWCFLELGKRGGFFDKQKHQEEPVRRKKSDPKKGTGLLEDCPRGDEMVQEEIRTVKRRQLGLPSRVRRKSRNRGKRGPDSRAKKTRKGQWRGALQLLLGAV